MGRTLLLGFFFSWKYLDKAVGPERVKKQLMLDSLLTEEQEVGLAPSPRQRQQGPLSQYLPHLVGLCQTHRYSILDYVFATLKA